MLRRTVVTQPRRTIDRRTALGLLLVSVAAGRALRAARIRAAQQPLTEEERAWLARAERRDVDGWIHLRIRGAAFERGFQHGYLTAAEWAEAQIAYKLATLQTIGMDYSFFVEHAAELHRDKITPELIEEMSGIAAGLTKAGVPATLDDIIGWNAYFELTGYWWPTVATQYANSAPQGQRKNHCSAFIATGAATRDGRVVIGHESFIEFWMGQFLNVILDITPDQGRRMVMQTSPGWVASMTDFWVTGAGLAIVETTLVGYQGYAPDKVPEYVRARVASQYAADIDGWVRLMDAQNDGGYANAWPLYRAITCWLISGPA